MSAAGAAGAAGATGAKQTEDWTLRTCLTALLVLVVLALLVGGVIGYVISGRNYTAHSTYVLDMTNPSQASATPTLHITAARGDPIAFVIRIGGAEEWATTGIYMTLSGVNGTLQIVEPKEKNWDNTYSIKFGSETQTQGSTVIPTSISGPEETHVSGTILGDVIQPGPLGDGTQPVNIPVDVQLHAPESFHWSNGRNTFYIFAGIIALVLGGLCLGTVGLIVTNWRKRRKQERGAAAKAEGGFLGVVGVALGGVAFGVLFPAALWLALSVWLLSEYPDVVLHNHLPDMLRAILLLAGLVGVLICLFAFYGFSSDERTTSPTR